jgi:hypothetical protein
LSFKPFTFATILYVCLKPFPPLQKKPSLFLLPSILYSCHYHHSIHLQKYFKIIYNLKIIKS